ncbi:MAG: hypothetical protein BWK76_10785 [Desulfobulbaceae bacterium A2]|nr:MAG: hypothetical protein BWK76_10785 [Desulfobulbaceae bacterium A2]
MTMRLTPRDRRALLLGGLLLGLLFIIFQVLLPLAARQQRLQQGNSRRTTALAEMRQLAGEYAALSRQGQDVAARLAARPGNVSLFAVLEQAAVEAGVREQVISLTPAGVAEGAAGEQRAEMRLKGVDLARLVDLLARIEQPALVIGLRRLNLQTDAAGSLDVFLEAVTLSAGASP